MSDPVAPDLRALYEETILDHNRRPRNFRRIEGALSAEGHNPLCGDRVTVYVLLDGDRIADVAFEGSGCAISKASASMMTEAIHGRSRAEAEALLGRFRGLLSPEGPGAAEGMGKLAVFAGVRDFPARVKCAVLAWHALTAALTGANPAVSTE